MFDAVLLDHLRRYPALQIQDLYKLIHQAALGSEHAVPNRESARRWLERELAEMGDGPAEPILDPISADGAIARVHLRPYLAPGGQADALLEAFVRTANEHRGDMGQVEHYWEIARKLAEDGSLPFEPSALKDFFGPLRDAGFPAVHHSPEFENLYRPAYRVLLRQLLS